MVDDHNELGRSDEVEMDQEVPAASAPLESGIEGQDFYYEDLELSSEDTATKPDLAADQAGDDLTDI